MLIQNNLLFTCVDEFVRLHGSTSSLNVRYIFSVLFNQSKMLRESGNCFLRKTERFSEWIIPKLSLAKIIWLKAAHMFGLSTSVRMTGQQHPELINIPGLAAWEVWRQAAHDPQEALGEQPPAPRRRAQRYGEQGCGSGSSRFHIYWSLKIVNTYRLPVWILETDR